MAWRYQAQVLESGVVVDPRDFMRNENEFAQEFAGYFDRDNVTTSNITSAKNASQVFTAVFSNSISGSPAQTIVAGDTGVWTEVTSATISHAVEDGTLEVDADVCCNGGSTYSDLNNIWQARLVVNGDPIAYTGWTHFNRLQTTVSLTGSAPTVQTTASFQIQIRCNNAPSYHISDVNQGKNTATTSAYNLTQTTGDLWIMAANIVVVNRKR